MKSTRQDLPIEDFVESYILLSFLPDVKQLLFSTKGCILFFSQKSKTSYFVKPFVLEKRIAHLDYCRKTHQKRVIIMENNVIDICYLAKDLFISLFCSLKGEKINLFEMCS
jgi:hypothetical protein